MQFLHFYELFYFWVIIIGWIVIPAIIGIGLFIFFVRITNAHKKHKDFINDRKFRIKLGYRWNGTPYQKDAGWGTKFDKRSEDEYFVELNKKRKADEAKQNKN